MGRCVICLRHIERPAELRTIRLADSEFLAHGFCLLRLRRLACEMNGATSPIPTLTRALTLNEFLLTKRPRTDAEILCCIAFYQKHNDSKTGLSAPMVRQQLRLSAFKIADVPSALQEASEKLGYLKRQAEMEQEAFVLTEKGLQIVKHLPAAPG